MSKSALVISLFLATLFSLCCAPIAASIEISDIRDDLSRESLLAAVQQSRIFLDRLPASRPIGLRPRTVTAGEMKTSLQRFAETLTLWDRPEKLAEALRSRFDFVPPAAAAERKDLLVTGYYLPTVEGSLSETAEYRYPIYRKPDDPAAAALTRGEIDIHGRLKGKGYEIAWVKDSIDLFFLHIQGSGVLRLSDGRRMQLNYAATNGRPYTSIGKILLDEGKIRPEELSAPRVRRYLADNAEQSRTLIARNERYVFFRFVEGGPFGSLEVPLTTGRSVAADAEHFPRGAPAFLTTRLPAVDAAGNLAGWRRTSRFVVVQDSGAAIRGPGRLDLYFGAGEEAGHEAGFMKSGGSVYILLEKKTRR